MPPLVSIQQDDFSAGMVRSVARHLIPPNGCYDLLNLLLDDDGSAYRRGGSVYKSGAVFGSGGLRWIWDARLGPGRRTVFADSNDFAVLAADDRSAVNLGGAGLSAPVGAAALGGLLFIDGGVVYGGSRLAADYSTGTLTATQGSTAVTGSGTLWRANADAGMLLSVAGGQLYAVRSVSSDTALVLDRPFVEATAAARTYTLRRLGTPAVTGPIYAAGGDRLMVGDGSLIKFSQGRDPNTGELRYGVFDATDNMPLPDGVEILGAQMLRDQLLVFTTEGVWAVANVPLELTDDFGNPQRRLDKVTGDLVLWGRAGIAGWQNALVVPTVDGVMLVDGVSVPTPVARSIAPVIREYVRTGYACGGGTVYANHYFLPVLNGADVVDLLVCRLDRPVETRAGVIFPWSRMDGHGAEVTAVTQRVGGAAEAREPALLAAGSDGRVLSLGSFFEPAAAVASDADAVAHDVLLETRDFATGTGNRNTVLRLQVRYELYDAAAADPVLIARYSIGAAQEGVPYWGEVDWGGFDWSDPRLADFVTLADGAPESVGRDPFVWRFAARGRFIRGRLESSLPAARLVLRSLEWGLRSNAKDR
jgi:hypothetical protein